jgi:tripartite-type tricarboxylate transporter receptor subunit TctC
MRKVSGAMLVLGATMVASDGAFAIAPPAYPTRPVRIVVGYAPGGGADLLARMVGRTLNDVWRQPVIVENRAGAGGTIAAGIVANAPADGYTMLMITSNHAVPSRDYSLQYDPVKSYAPIVEIAYIPSALLVATALRAPSLRALLDIARTKPGVLNFGSTGTGSTQYMDMQLLMQATGVSMVNVTYKGAAPILVALLSDEIQLAAQPITAFIESVRAGRLKALAVSGKVRSSLLPDVPTYTEIPALNGFEGSANWYGIVAPAGTPAALVERLRGDIVRATGGAELRSTLSDQGYVAVNGTPRQFAQRIAFDAAKWARLAERSSQ